MRPIRFTFGPLAAASANNIATSQTLGAAGNFAINGSAASGGVATLDQPRRVLITSAGNDSAVTFTVTGTARNGQKISESLLGANVGAVFTNNDFLTITQVAASAATSAVTIGTNTVASIWVPLDWMANPTNVSVNAIVSGTINFTINQTWDDPYPASGLVPANWKSLQAAGAVTIQGLAVTNTTTALQFVINSGGGSIGVQIVSGGGTTGA